MVEHTCTHTSQFNWNLCVPQRGSYQSVDYARTLFRRWTSATHIIAKHTRSMYFHRSVLFPTEVHHPSISRTVKYICNLILLSTYGEGTQQLNTHAYTGCVCVCVCKDCLWEGDWTDRDIQRSQRPKAKPTELVLKLERKRLKIEMKCRRGACGRFDLWPKPV